MFLGVPQNLWDSLLGGNLSLVPRFSWVLIHFLLFVPLTSHGASFSSFPDSGIRSPCVSSFGKQEGAILSGNA